MVIRMQSAMPMPFAAQPLMPSHVQQGPVLQGYAAPGEMFGRMSRQSTSRMNSQPATAVPGEMLSRMTSHSVAMPQVAKSYSYGGSPYPQRVAARSQLSNSVAADSSAPVPAPGQVIVGTLASPRLSARGASRNVSPLVVRQVPQATPQGMLPGAQSPPIVERRISTPQVVPTHVGYQGPTPLSSRVPSSCGSSAMAPCSSTIAPANISPRPVVTRAARSPTRSVSPHRPATPSQGNSAAAPAGLPFAAPSSPILDHRTTLKVIQDLLKDRDLLKRSVIQCFVRAAGGAKGHLDLHGLINFRNMLANVFQVPQSAFGDITNEFLCFDFDGSGRLELNESYKLVKFQFFEYLKRYGGGVGRTVDIPFKTMEQAGFRIVQELGRGSQGIVYLVCDTGQRDRCVKSFSKSQMCAATITELKEEFETMQLLECERIAQVSELFQDTMYYYMVGEHYSGGDFTSLKVKARQQGVQMNQSWWRGIFKQCIEALAFMHEQAMIHCDIKEPNIMLKTGDFHVPQVVLIDFGVAKAMAAANENCLKGTPGYMPPETLDQAKWFPRGDVFSMGVCIMQLLTDKLPPTGMRTVHTPGGIFIEGCASLQEIAMATRTRQPPFRLLPPETAGLNRLLPGMLAKRMQERPTATNLRQDPWFATENGSPSEQSLPIRGRNTRATAGITRSFLHRVGAVEDASTVPEPKAVAAIHQIQMMYGCHSAENESTSSNPAPTTPPVAAVAQEHLE